MGRSSGRPARLVAAGLAAVALLLAGCDLGRQMPAPSPSSSTATPRWFTVASTDAIRVTDPAAITDAASALLSTNVFQRLMTAEPGTQQLRGDAARDCLFTGVATVTCTLQKNLAFSNGHPLTSSDVKFSIERATRLNVPGSSASLLSSLRRIETPDPQTVRFVLSRADSQFAWALASPAASIVDEEVYDADRVATPKDQIVGSGPFQVVSLGENELRLARYPNYVGRTPARLAQLAYRTLPDSASLEDAMNKGTVDAVWRGLDSAAVTRFSQQVQQSPEHQTSNGYGEKVLTGVRVLQLRWSPTSKARANKALRQAITTSLQGDRTSDSVVPGGVPGHVAAFPLGGKATAKVTWQNRINLTLGYDPTMPNGQDIATQIRTRLENTGGLSVQLKPGTDTADLMLLDRKAWTATAIAWLQPYLDAPLAASASTVASTESAFLTETNEALAAKQLAALQEQAAADQVVLPISQSDEHLYIRAGVSMNDTSFGPGWQLGLFGIGYA